MNKEKNKLKVKEPEELLEKFGVWFDKPKKMAFIITLVVGILTHITMITEMIMSQDGLWNSIEYFRPGDWETTLGRWGIALIQRLNFFIAIPTVSTISCIISMAIVSVFLVDLFDFKSKISIIFTSIILVVTPTLTATLLYVYTSFSYCFNFLIAVLVVWFIYKFKYKKTGIVLSTLCCTLSLSIYQSYIGISIGLCVMISILDIIRNKKELKEVFINLLKFISVIIVGGVLYYLITIILLDVLKLEISTYKGCSNFKFADIFLNLHKSIICSYRDFINFFIKNDIVYNTNYRREIFYIAFLISYIIISIVSMFEITGKEKKEKILKVITVAVGIIILPICLNIIDILIVGNEMYSLTAVQMILMIPFTFAIFENTKRVSIIKWVAVISCLYVIATYYIADNTSYAALKLTYNQAYSTTARILDRMENTPGYKKEYPILFGGIVGNDNFPRTSSLYTYTIGTIVNNTTFHGSYYGALGTWYKFLKLYFGIDVDLCSEDVYYNIVNGEEYKNMDVFPGKDSIRIRDGIIIVKLSNNPPMPY